ncbi:MAG: diguanylate cyclase [Polyangiales bacterium]
MANKRLGTDTWEASLAEMEQVAAMVHGRVDKEDITNELAVQVQNVRGRDRCTLTVVSGPALGQLFSLIHEKELVIGRSVTSQAHVDDLGMSRRHLRIVRDGDAFYAEDLGSKNGSYLRGKRIHDRQRLSDGDRLQLGPNTLIKVGFFDEVEHEAMLQVYEWTVRDPLTRLYNRRHLDERCAAEFAFAKRHESSLSVLWIDIDHFKRLNDTHGHQAGDAVLSALAGFLARVMRTEDVAGRYGGEEFVVLLRRTPLSDALALAERLCRGVRALAVPWDGEELRTTVSIGVACYVHAQGFSNAEELLKAADAAMYRAKNSGRDRASL